MPRPVRLTPAAFSAIPCARRSVDAMRRPTRRLWHGRGGGRACPVEGARPRRTSPCRGRCAPCTRQAPQRLLGKLVHVVDTRQRRQPSGASRRPRRYFDVSPLVLLGGAADGRLGAERDKAERSEHRVVLADAFEPQQLVSRKTLLSSAGLRRTCGTVFLGIVAGAAQPQHDATQRGPSARSNGPRAAAGRLLRTRRHRRQHGKVALVSRPVALLAVAIEDLAMPTLAWRKGRAQRLNCDERTDCEPAVVVQDRVGGEPGAAWAVGALGPARARASGVANAALQGN